jgi:hypothetical protein
MNFILKGSEISALQLKGISKYRTSMEYIQKKYNTYIKIMHGTCF